MTDIVKFSQLISAVTQLCGYKMLNQDVVNLLKLVEECYPEVAPQPHWTKPLVLQDIVRMFEHMKGQRKIEAIKELRNMTNAGLKEAKDTIEIIYDRIQFE